MALDTVFLTAVKPAIIQTWGGIAPDACVEDNEEAIELVCDADRLTFAGYPEAGRFVSDMCAAWGWDKVCQFLAKHINLC